MGYEENIEDRLFNSTLQRNEDLKKEIVALRELVEEQRKLLETVKSSELKQEVKNLQSLIVRLENAVRSQLPRRQW